MKKLVALLLLICSIQWSTAQTAAVDTLPEVSLIQEYEDTLALLSYAVIHDSLAENRFLACKALIKTLVKALKTDDSFDYKFPKLQSVSIQYPADSTFRIFTWQLYVDVNEYRYYGAIQMNSPDLKLFPLIDRSFEIQEDLAQAILSPKKWYGSLCYNIKQTDHPELGRYYLIFGFDWLELFRKRKVIDVLTFDEKGQPVFGAPVIYKSTPDQPNFPVNRLLVEYSAEVSIRLNYDEFLEMIIHDHLVTMPGPHGEGPTNYPDGSYEGYKLKDGVWVNVTKVFDQVSEDPPRPLPILDKRKKDIFGKQ